MSDQVILGTSKDKLAAALKILFASVDAYAPFDPGRRYSHTRNRIAHEYLPEELKKIYADIVGPAATELRYVLGRCSALPREQA